MVTQIRLPQQALEYGRISLAFLRRQLPERRISLAVTP
jgi:hypothetical protein